MTTATLLTSAFGGTLAAMAGLSLSMPRYYRQCRPTHTPPGNRQHTVLRWGGWALLVTTLALCACAVGIGTGMVYWFGLLTAAAICVVLILTYAPSQLPLVSLVAMLLAALPWLIQLAATVAT